MRILIPAAVFAALLVGVLPASAQEPGVAVDIERVAATTPTEKREFAAQAVEEMRKYARDAAKWLESARKANDVERIQCLNTRLTQVRALLSVSEVAQREMTGLLDGTVDTENRDAKADHEMRKVAVALDKARQLYSEAVECEGDSDVASGQTRVQVVDPGYEGDDVADVFSDEMDVGFDPPDLSPFE